ncbi:MULTISPECIES: hypothetical protein [unclassified Microcoleus]|uniref:hypothetical protein n=1 Tax=unclassified Microcoleus TaxID=2642155 RepID=UPI002FD04FF3
MIDVMGVGGFGGVVGVASFLGICGIIFFSVDFWENLGDNRKLDGIARQKLKQGLKYDYQ